MSASSDTAPSPGTESSRGPALRTVQWVGVCLVGLTAFTLVAAHVPGRMRLLGLFAVAFGGLCGWGTSRLAAALRAAAGRIRGPVIAGVLVAAAEIGLTCESWRLYVAERRREYFESSMRKVPAPLRESTLEKLRPIFERETRFQAYLQHRVKNLGDWQPHWPAVFWAGEVVLGTAAGVAAFLLAGRRAAGKG